MQIDILAFAAHPDDVELAASGTLLSQKALGQTIGIVDLTRGELGTRGSAEIRDQESLKSSKILKLDYRNNLALKDGFFEINKDSLYKVIQEIRHLKPTLILANSLSDRHPDHGKGAKLVAEACFLAGLSKIETNYHGKKQEIHRPKQLLHYIQDQYLTPDVVMDISSFIDVKNASINAYSSQFYQENQPNNEANTPISGKNFKLFLDGRARQFGRIINTEFGEGFNTSRPISVTNLIDLL